jgi:hypothetical protein
LPGQLAKACAGWLPADIVVGVDVNTAINIVLVAATILVVVFAKQTVTEARNTTAEEKKTVAELQKLVQAADETAASSAYTMQAARETAEVSRTAREADRRYRQLEQLRAIHRLVQDIGRAADNAVPPSISVQMNWRCARQDELTTAIVGAVPQLPKCRELAGKSGVVEVAAAVGCADAELGHAFRSLGAEGG